KFSQSPIQTFARHHLQSDSNTRVLSHMNSSFLRFQRTYQHLKNGALASPILSHQGYFGVFTNRKINLIQKRFVFVIAKGDSAKANNNVSVFHRRVPMEP